MAWFNVVEVDDAEVEKAISTFSSFAGDFRKSVKVWYEELLEEPQVEMIEEALTDLAHTCLIKKVVLSTPAQSFSGMDALYSKRCGHQGVLEPCFRFEDIVDDETIALLGLLSSLAVRDIHTLYGVTL